MLIVALTPHHPPACQESLPELLADVGAGPPFQGCFGKPQSINPVSYFGAGGQARPRATSTPARAFTYDPLLLLPTRDSDRLRLRIRIGRGLIPRLDRAGDAVPL